MKKRVSNKWYWIGAILLALIAARAAMPYYVARYVNKALSNLEGYSGSISDVDIHLYRGAYSIDSLRIFRKDGNKEVPFVDIPVTDVSVEWRSLLDGALVGELIFERPQLNFIAGSEPAGNQDGGDVDWTRPIKDLMPLEINRMEIQHGTINFYNFTTEPKVSISLNSLDAVALNLSNASDQPERLPSTISASATSEGGGKLTLSAGINVLKEIPDMDLDMKFEKIDMRSMNDFFMAYADVDVEKGSFNLYSEVTIDNGVVGGYVKPIAVDVKVVNLKKDKEKPLNLLWQSFVGLITEVFDNQKEDQFATKVLLDGNLNTGVEVGVWPSVWNIFGNAFVKAFELNTDSKVEFAGRGNDRKLKNNDGKDATRIEARDEKKADRRRKREERKENRKDRKRNTKPS